MKTPSPLAALAFAEFRVGLHRFLLRKLKSSATAEDLAQEVYLRLLRAADPTQVKCPQAYVYRVAFNVLYEYRLREQGQPMIFDSDALADAAERLPDQGALPEDIYEDGARARLFERAVDRLPPMQRAVLRLATQHNLSHAQIGKRLGIAVSTVRNHLYKAIDACRHQVMDAQGEGDRP